MYKRMDVQLIVFRLKDCIVSLLQRALPPKFKSQLDLCVQKSRRFNVIFNTSANSLFFICFDPFLEQEFRNNSNWCISDVSTASDFVSDLISM